MSARKTVLVVEDDGVNRAVLSKLLSVDYEVTAVENGCQALQRLRQMHGQIACVMLDIVMPVMDGYGFLTELSQLPEYENIPIIVVTDRSEKDAESKALALGAWDFVCKPYDPAIIRFRVKNAIDRSRLSAYAEMKYMAEYDGLTGIFNKTKFISATERMLKEHGDESFVFVRFDIDRFSLVNAFYGQKTGDDLLRYVGKTLAGLRTSYPLLSYGRMSADVFAFCARYSDTYKLIGLIQRSLKQYNLNYDIVPVFGIYKIHDRSLSVHQMLDNAALASKQIKGNYINTIQVYSEDLSQRLQKEQEIVNDMQKALEQRQFVVYLQPKYSLLNQTFEGAEALVRWQHPSKGMISPSEFIPIFERNGFIERLDYTIWDQVCAMLRKWMNEGKPPYPISVNISRVNIYSSHFVESICALTEKYDVPNYLLQLELTESVYTDNPPVISNAIKKLHSAGFTILMDDFGSGYSSLNVLKDMDVDILKIDMRFLSATENKEKSETIIASVIRMAKQLGIPTVAEGVETADQVTFLSSVGCEYVQGYYYARPMSQQEYERQMENARRQSTTVTTVEKSSYPLTAQVQQLLKEETQPVAFYEVCNSEIYILRANNTFYRMFRYGEKYRGTVNPMRIPKSDYAQDILAFYQSAIAIKGSMSQDMERKMSDGSIQRFRANIQYVETIGDKDYLYGTFCETSCRKYRLLSENDYRQDVYAVLLLCFDGCAGVELSPQLRDGTVRVQCDDCHTGIEAMEQRGAKADALLVCMERVESPGVEFLKYKKSHAVFSNLPVVVVTKNPKLQGKMDKQLLCVNDYVLLPMDQSELAERLKIAVRANARFQTVLHAYYRMAVQAERDPLTDLYNHAKAEAMISAALQEQPHSRHALIMMDIDNFKKLNDQYGHIYGDYALVEFSNKLSRFFQDDGDVVSRFGGDEFCVFLAEVRDEEAMLSRCQELVDEMSGLQINGKELQLTLSMGVTVAQPDTCPVFESLYAKADAALYDSKRSGKNGLSVIYSRHEPEKQTGQALLPMGN